MNNQNNAIINPWETAPKIKGFPKLAITTFSPLLFQALLDNYPHKLLLDLNSAISNIKIYEIEVSKMKVAVFLSPMGASACVAACEEMFSTGIENLILFGTCGVLDSRIGECSILIPTTSIVEEGTSRHYNHMEAEIEMDQSFTLAFKKFLDSKNVSYVEGKNWTTDAIFRETVQKVEKYKKEKVISVEMEASAVRAMAKFRNKKVLHFFYAADSLDAQVWEERNLNSSASLAEKSKIWSLVIEFVGENKNLFQ